MSSVNHVLRVHAFVRARFFRNAIFRDSFPGKNLRAEMRDYLALAFVCCSRSCRFNGLYEMVSTYFTPSQMVFKCCKGRQKSSVTSIWYFLLLDDCGFLLSVFFVGLLQRGMPLNFKTSLS
jgi:hypothetical protein